MYLLPDFNRPRPARPVQARPGRKGREIFEVQSIFKTRISFKSQQFVIHPEQTITVERYKIVARIKSPIFRGRLLQGQVEILFKSGSLDSAKPIVSGSR
jgi:hypothetical protein